MNKLTISALITILLVSCLTAKVHPLKGNYESTAGIKSGKPFDSVWSNVIDLFATKGIGIKIIDRGSGLIISEKTSFKQNYTFEKSGKPINPNAWIVLSPLDVSGMALKPGIVTAEWNVRVKGNADGCQINVNVTNIVAELYSPSGTYTSEHTYVFEAKSTGVFEKIIYDYVK